MANVDRDAGPRVVARAPQCYGFGAAMPDAAHVGLVGRLLQRYGREGVPCAGRGGGVSGGRCGAGGLGGCCAVIDDNADGFALSVGARVGDDLVHCGSDLLLDVACDGLRDWVGCGPRDVVQAGDGGDEAGAGEADTDKAFVVVYLARDVKVLLVACGLDEEGPGVAVGFNDGVGDAGRSPQNSRVRAGGLRLGLGSGFRV
ncbi:hypothetical protein [Streptomyces sp. 049-1]|uniref:hypothetical protein n=1 Tax=Streptomyces sp. 049-1 TaxID=2789264 RepID=UPI00397F84D1